MRVIVVTARPIIHRPALQTNRMGNTSRAIQRFARVLFVFYVAVFFALVISPEKETTVVALREGEGAIPALLTVSTGMLFAAAVGGGNELGRPEMQMEPWNALDNEEPPNNDCGSTLDVDKVISDARKTMGKNQLLLLFHPDKFDFPGNQEKLKEFGITDRSECAQIIKKIYRYSNG